MRQSDSSFVYLSRETMRIPSERLKLSIALALITSFTVPLLWYPFSSEHLARNGDQKALQAIRQWHFWNPFFILGLAIGWAVLFSIMRQSGDRSRIICVCGVRNMASGDHRARTAPDGSARLRSIFFVSHLKLSGTGAKTRHTEELATTRPQYQIVRKTLRGTEV